MVPYIFDVSGNFFPVFFLFYFQTEMFLFTKWGRKGKM